MDDPVSFLELGEIKHRLYTTKEVERLSVLCVSQPKTFDALGYPLPGGLYDLALGATSRGEICSTCGQRDLNCPGHMGHIQLALPAFNPLLFSFTYNLFKGTCVNCHRFMCQLDGTLTSLLLSQLRCIELGCPKLAERIAQRIADVKANAESKDEQKHLLENLSNFSIDQLDEAIATMSNTDVQSLRKQQGAVHKNTYELRRSLIHDFMRAHLFKHVVKCPLCHRRTGNIRNDSGRSILIDFGSGGIQGKSSMKYNRKSSQNGTEDAADADPMDVGFEENADDDADNSKLADGDKTAIALQLEEVQAGGIDKLSWRAQEVRDHFREVWKHDGHVLKQLFSIFNNTATGKSECPMDVLFFEVIMIPPNKFRPIQFFGGERYEDTQTIAFRKILEVNLSVHYLQVILSNPADANSAETTKYRVHVESNVVGKSMPQKLHNSYLSLQVLVNGLYDSDTLPDRNATGGIRQLLEKKQGLFRMHMMGKRVNFACRSVITPDPYLDVDEIGIPEVFAKALTFQEPPNAHNIDKLRKAIENGALKHPGANFIHKGEREKVSLQPLTLPIRRGEANRLPVINSDANSNIRVLRHLRNGDMVLMNRQPSLHKPSIMGHRVRVLRGQKALRMNYAPCKAYNADFDGDEMNGHFVQSRMAQTEAAEIASVGASYLVPKDGTPILGLIQDHVVSAVLLTVRDRFLEKKDFMHLLLAAFARSTKRIKIPPPAIDFPRQLWTGKQVVTAMIQNCIPENAPRINLAGKAKTPISCWKVPGHANPPFEMSESEVIFSQGALVSGVLDKAHFGATQYGFIHCCYELYGHKTATLIMSCFSRCFTTYLQFHGFSLGVADILVNDDADKIRHKAIKQLRKQGDTIVKKTFHLSDEANRVELKHALAKTYNNKTGDKTSVKQYDYAVKQTIGRYTEKLNDACVPAGLIRLFPQNSLQLMIQSGAKGSSVNAIQISAALGQIELEGQRPPLSATGRTLPSFKAFDTAPRAGGFVDQRFLTGVNPQELFFHTMAGREGLIDTAVKTSRSGYLQRCIIKHLEGITAQYDGTVRDHDGSVIQFRYGEDGFDVGKATFLNPKHFGFLTNNIGAVQATSVPRNATDENWHCTETEHAYRKIRRRRKDHILSKGERQNGFTIFSQNYSASADPKVIKAAWHCLPEADRMEYEAQAPRPLPDCLNNEFNPYNTLGALPEKITDEIYKYSTECMDPDVKRILFWKGLRALVDPGECVGLLAAQSIGEPSTQMTLNTFHFAGRGEMNVTLGIPRLREILMTSGKNIATPTAEVLIQDSATEENVEQLRQKFNRVFLKNCVKKISVEERISITHNALRHFVIGIEILKAADREPEARHLKRKTIIQCLEEKFLKSITAGILKKTNDLHDYTSIVHHRLRIANAMSAKNEDDDDSEKKPVVNDEVSSDEEAGGGGDADAAEARLHNRHLDDVAEYEGEAEEENEVGDKEPAIEDAFDNYEDSEGETEEQAEDGDPENKAATTVSDEQRRQRVMQLSQYCDDYRVDAKNRWCVFSLTMDLKRENVDVEAVVSSVVETLVVHEVKGVEKCVIREENRKGKDVKILQTQGINTQALHDVSKIIDVNTIYFNDINLMRDNYGIEACNRVIVNEMNNVFGAYGIDVNPRHLTLIADYMTFTGVIAPFSRTAMASSTSPFQKMTFETTLSFMRDTIIYGDVDYNLSPSARIVTGTLMKAGTGAFDLVSDKGLLFDRDEEKSIDYSKQVIFESDSD